jgi:hypothetical protein
MSGDEFPARYHGLGLIQWRVAQLAVRRTTPFEHIRTANVARKQRGAAAGPACSKFCGLGTPACARSLAAYPEHSPFKKTLDYKAIADSQIRPRTSTDGKLRSLNRLLDRGHDFAR